MSELTIYCEGKNRPIREAIGVLTDDWIDGGNCCDQTKIDLRDAVKQLMAINAELLVACESVVMHCNWWSGENTCSGPNDHRMINGTDFNKLKAAIAKAK